MTTELGVTLKEHHAASEPLTICLAAETYAPEVNGAAVFAERLARGLASRGHSVHVICPSPSGYERSERAGDVWVHYIRSWHWPWHPTWMICMPWWVKPAVKNLIDTIKPDVIHAQAHFVIGRYAIAEATARNIPLVATNHFMPNNVEPYILAPGPVRSVGTRMAWRDLKNQFEQADYLTVPTQLAADLLTENGFTRHVRPVSCGIDLSEFSPSDEPAGDKPPSVLFVGRLSSEKHIEDLLAAVARTSPELNLHATIIGAGEQLQALKQQAQDLGIADRVNIPGKVSQEQLVQAYKDATFFCMPSTAELQSIATLEALASGKPVVLADAVALPHLVRHGENGYLFEPRNVDELATAFTRLATAGEEDLGHMSEVSQTIARQHDISHTVSTFEDIYRAVIAQKS